MPKFATHDNFAMIANFRYHSKSIVHSENFNFRYACIFCYDSENHCVRTFLLLFFLSKRIRFGFYPFYPHCNFVVSYCFVISLFLSIYKPQSVTNSNQSLHNKFFWGKLSAPVFPLFSFSLHFLSFSWLPNTL